MALCAKAALRSGAGLVTIAVKKEGYPRLACLAPTESMVYELEEGVSEAILHKKCDGNRDGHEKRQRR